MQFENDRDQEKEPSLSEMTVKALEILQKYNNGFFLMVEGEKIILSRNNTNIFSLSARGLCIILSPLYNHMKKADFLYVEFEAPSEISLIMFKDSSVNFSAKIR